MAGISKHAKGDDKKKKVDWSCRHCTKGAIKALRCKRHLNYASSDLCIECGEYKSEVHLCAFADLGFKLRSFNGQGSPNVIKDSGKGKANGKQGKDSPTGLQGNAM